MLKLLIAFLRIIVDTLSATLSAVAIMWTVNHWVIPEFAFLNPLSFLQVFLVYYIVRQFVGYRIFEHDFMICEEVRHLVSSDRDDDEVLEC